ncbi:PDZ domain-containing protein [Thalassoglobus polymorphus]|uniref:Putative periplasmic serine endoprotease DegP-like n=1 Tax=Thalassoglobus polymorphus TaxID=2527994 RepID=A0A517QT42_9PLAN|nr:PDZ domain-containing protein [Thalassoglobus polymorphus]QDT34748.1 putative periplasmic serine endoprotease DegP-like precursor [Thalassoglobus polymorphus]
MKTYSFCTLFILTTTAALSTRAMSEVQVVSPNVAPETNEAGVDEAVPVQDERVVTDQTDLKTRNRIIITGPDGKKYSFDSEDAIRAPVIVKDLVKPYLVPESELDPNDLYFIGITVKKIPDGYHELLGVRDQQGLLVTAVIDDGPAAIGGLQKFDLLMQVNDQPVLSLPHLQSEVRKSEGEAITLTIRRKQEILDVQVAPILWEDLDDNARHILDARRHRIPESLSPLFADHDHLYDDSNLLVDDTSLEVTQLRDELNQLRGEVEARQELILKKIEQLQAESLRNQNREVEPIPAPVIE